MSGARVWLVRADGTQLISVTVIYFIGRFGWVRARGVRRRARPHLGRCVTARELKEGIRRVSGVSGDLLASQQQLCPNDLGLHHTHTHVIETTRYHVILASIMIM